jgi:glutaredoxin
MITLYTKDNCPYCDGAKSLLKSMKEEYTEIDINELGVRDWLKEQGHKTVPQIYWGDKLLVEGGYTGLKDTTTSQLQEKKRAIIENA